MVNSFSDTNVQGNNGGTVGILIGASSSTITNSYYANNRSCVNLGGACLAYGSGIDLVANPNGFFLKANSPLSSWDFNSVWLERPNDYPILKYLDGKM